MQTSSSVFRFSVPCFDIILSHLIFEALIGASFSFMVKYSMFWDQFTTPFAILAPMEGVTDVAFRQVVARAAPPEIFFTEFTNVSSYASEAGRNNALERLQFAPGETGANLVAQIWGKNPAHFAATAQGVAALGYQALDINMGCPDRHVVANGGGADLIRHPELAAELIAAARPSGLAVSVKTRLGYSRVEEWRDWLSFLLRQNLAALTVHLRTKKEMSKVAAHHELIPAIVELRNQLAPNTKLIINGDISDRCSGQRLAEQFGFEGIMIGRGVFQNPFCFETRPTSHSRQELLDLLKLHLGLWRDYDRLEPLKRFFKIYVRDFPGAAELRERLMLARNLGEIKEELG